MASVVVILHGYSDTRKSFAPLAAFLRNNGFRVASIFLGDYITLEDHVTIPDLAKAFVNALASKKISVKKAGIDLMVHSTGALVAREWLTRCFLEPQLPCPLAHFLMLAPANFGSPRGHLGKTMLGRVIKGWKTGFESGTQVLNALELASPYTRHLSAAPLGQLIGSSAGAANDISESPVDETNTRFWRPNGTLMLDLVIERTQNENMFGLYAPEAKR
jgi:hypothetical protein